MKKRIIALLMVVVLCVSVLAGCAYDYEKEDLTKYSTADGAAMKAAFRLLEIEDGTFTTDKETREKLKEATQNISASNYSKCKDYESKLSKL